VMYVFGGFFIEVIGSEIRKWQYICSWY